MALVAAGALHKRVAVDPHALVTADGDEHPVDVRILVEVHSNLRDGNLRRTRQWEAIGAGRDGGECDRYRPDRRGQLETFAIARSEELVFSGVPTLPDRTDRMDDPLRGQVKSRREPSLAGRATADLAGGFQEAGPGGAVDRAIDPAATEERAIRRVDDGIDRQRGDIGLDDVDAIGHGWATNQ